MTPTDFFQYVSDGLNFLLTAWRTSLALVLLVYMYRFPFRWESVLILIGLAMIIASPWLPVSTIGELLFWPGAVVFVARQYGLNQERFLQCRPPPVGKPIADYATAAIKNTFNK